MIQWFSKKLRNRKGFTLIELIVVIAILGILALIAIPRLGGFRDSADKSAAEAGARTILTALSVKVAENPDLSLTEGSIDSDELDGIDALLGDIRGDVSDINIDNGSIDFDYELGKWTIEVRDGSFTEAEE